MPKFTFFFSLIVLVSWCCSSMVPENSVLVKPSIKSGAIVFDTINGVPFSCFFPYELTDSKDMDICFIFDPEGKPSSIITKLKGISFADSLIMVGCDFSKNGKNLVNIKNDFKILTEILDSVYGVKNSKSVALGFSGGARVSAEICSEFPQPSGAVLVGAGASEQSLNGQYQWKLNSLVGLKDFNFSEVFRMHAWLASKSDSSSSLMITTDNHKWPEKDVIKMALNKLRNDKQPQCHQEGPRLEQLSCIYGMQNSTLFFKEIESDSLLSADIRNMLNSEFRAKTYYGKAINEQDSVWWFSELIRLNKTVENDSDSMYFYFNERLKSHLGMLFYSHCSKAKDSKDWSRLKKINLLYGKLQPENHEYLINSAILFNLSGENKTSKAFLNRALQTGKISEIDVKKIDELKGVL